jgi:hypothetical protein
VADNDSLAWFHQLSSIDDKVALLANPYGELPAELVVRLSRHEPLVVIRTSETEPSVSKLLPSAADALGTERQRLDAWWHDRTFELRAALIKHRSGLIPADYRTAVIDCMPGGVIVADDHTGPFPLPPMMAVYVEWKARTAR